MVLPKRMPKCPYAGCRGIKGDKLESHFIVHGLKNRAIAVFLKAFVLLVQMLCPSLCRNLVMDEREKIQYKGKSSLNGIQYVWLQDGIPYLKVFIPNQQELVEEEIAEDVTPVPEVTEVSPEKIQVRIPPPDKFTPSSPKRSRVWNTLIATPKEQVFTQPGTRKSLQDLGYGPLLSTEQQQLKCYIKSESNMVSRGVGRTVLDNIKMLRRILHVLVNVIAKEPDYMTYLPLRIFDEESLTSLRDLIVSCNVEQKFLRNMFRGLLQFRKWIALRDMLPHFEVNIFENCIQRMCSHLRLESFAVPGQSLKEKKLALTLTTTPTQAVIWLYNPKIIEEIIKGMEVLASNACTQYYLKLFNGWIAAHITILYGLRSGTAIEFNLIEYERTVTEKVFAVGSVKSKKSSAFCVFGTVIELFERALEVYINFIRPCYAVGETNTFLVNLLGTPVLDICRVIKWVHQQFNITDPFYSPMEVRRLWCSDLADAADITPEIRKQLIQNMNHSASTREGHYITPTLTGLKAVNEVYHRRLLEGLADQAASSSSSSSNETESVSSAAYMGEVEEPAEEKKIQKRVRKRKLRNN